MDADSDPGNRCTVSWLRSSLAIGSVVMGRIDTSGVAVMLPFVRDRAP